MTPSIDGTVSKAVIDKGACQPGSTAGEAILHTEVLLDIHPILHLVFKGLSGDKCVHLCRRQQMLKVPDGSKSFLAFEQEAFQVV